MWLYRFSRILNKNAELYGFSGSYSQKNEDIWLFREHVKKKKELIAFFLMFIQE